jgi:hypothetical protein
MEHTEYKNRSKFDKIVAKREISIQRGQQWDKFGVESYVEVREGENPYEVAKNADAFNKVLINEFLSEPQQITWVKRKGPSGDYELASEKANENVPEFLELRQKLVNMGGSFTEENYYFWLFQDGRNVGKKQKQRS